MEQLHQLIQVQREQLEELAMLASAALNSEVGSVERLTCLMAIQRVLEGVR